MTAEQSNEKITEIQEKDVITATTTTRGRPRILSFIAILLALFAITASFYFWREAKTYGTETSTELSRLQDIVAKQRTRISDLQNQFQNSQHELEDQKRITLETQHSLQHYADLKASDNRTWMLAEVNHILRLAQYDLSFQQDISGSIALLKTAQQQLEVLNDPATLELRQAIATNITALEALPSIDTASLLVKLNAISLQILTMPLITDRIAETHSAATTTSAKNNWRNILDKSLQNLQQLIVIRHHDELFEPLMSPQQQINLSQMIQMKLHQASWAVLHRNPVVFQTSITQAQMWIKRYYAPNDSATISVLSNLNQLANVNLAPQLPDLTNTINLSQRLMSSTNAEKIFEK